MEQHTNSDSQVTLCKRTQVRCAACACGTCTKGSNPDAKYQVNKRDALALLDFIAGCLDNHSPQPTDRASWGEANSMARIRLEVMDIAMRFVSGEDEFAGAAKLERALSAGDEEVAGALIETT
jgi:hypothetical protein